MASLGGAAAGVKNVDQLYAKVGVNPALKGKGARVGLSDVDLAKTVVRGQSGDRNARAVALRAGVSNQEFFVPKKSFLDRISGGIEFVVPLVVAGGITGGVAAGFGVGPFAGTPTTVAAGTPAAPGASYSGMALAGGSGPVGTSTVAAGAGLGGKATIAAAGSLVKPVLATASTALSIKSAIDQGKASVSRSNPFGGQVDGQGTLSPVGVVPVTGGEGATGKTAVLLVLAALAAVILTR